MSHVLSLSDLVNAPGRKFAPHAIVPIPELAKDGGEPPVVYLVSPSAGRVLSLGASARVKKGSNGKDTIDPATLEENSKTMVELVKECAKTETGEPLLATEEAVRALPSFVFNRIVKAINALMLPEAVEQAGKE